VVANTKFALKAESSGADAIVAEGFEAGGHNGREETTTLCLIPMIRDAVSIPLIAAGGIGDGRSMLAAISLGADAVQVGSAFAVSDESSAHQKFKEAIVAAAEGETKLSMKSVMPVRLMKNEFFEQVEKAEATGGGKDELIKLLGRGRAKKGMFEGDLIEGELEIGQVSSMISEIRPAADILKNIWNDFLKRKEDICNLQL